MNQNGKDNNKLKFGEIIKPIIQFSPIGGSIVAFIHFVGQGEIFLSLITFPTVVLSLIWSAYSKSLLITFYEIYKEKGKKDAKSFTKWVDNLHKSIQETIKWQLTGVDDIYLRIQGNTCEDFQTEGYKPGGIFTVLLNEVFVPLSLSNDFMRSSEGEYLPMPPGFTWNEKTINLIEKEGLIIWDILRQAKRILAYKRLAIISWGGYGKTTLLKHITYIYTNKKEKKYQAPKLLPVLLLLREWESIIIEKKDLELSVLIEKYHIPKLPEGEILNHLPDNWAKNHLKDGTMLIMIDGFDEVKEKFRKYISEWIGKEMNKYPKTTFIITSRPSGYQDFVDQYKLKAELFIKPFNLSQQEDFIKNWYFYQEKYTRGGRNTPNVELEATNKASNLLNQLKKRPELNALSKNPLLLNIITNLHYYYPGEQLPKRRSELYREIINLQLGNRCLAKNIQLILAPDEAQEVLQDLALYMLEENKTSVEYKILLNKFKNNIKIYSNSIDFNKFIKELVEITELLVKRDKNYEFAHLSFQAYLAAREIIRTNKQELLINNWTNSWWTETILLYAGQINPNLFLKKLVNIGTVEALDLAYNCLKATPRVDIGIEKEVKSLLYKDLEKYLKDQDWLKADEETERLMIYIGDRDETRYLNLEEIIEFSEEDLLIINDLWIKYSNGKFGFTVQKKIWLSCGGIIKEYEHQIYKKFATRVGWYQITKGWFYTIVLNLENAPEGHFPILNTRKKTSESSIKKSIFLLSHKALKNY